MRVVANIIARANGVWAVIVAMVLGATLLVLNSEKDLGEKWMHLAVGIATLVIVASITTGRRRTFL